MDSAQSEQTSPPSVVFSTRHQHDSYTRPKTKSYHDAPVWPWPVESLTSNSTFAHRARYQRRPRAAYGSRSLPTLAHEIVREAIALDQSNGVYDNVRGGHGESTHLQDFSRTRLDPICMASTDTDRPEENVAVLVLRIRESDEECTSCPQCVH